MKKNMSNTDRVVRLLVVAVIAGLYFTNVISGLVATILAVLGGIFLLTSVISFCPIYAIFGISTCSVKENKVKES